ncbi:MAG: sulfatase-like hydrolase/transferase, partial [Candidatus Aminicenantes bacterium]|nr:sulfatase-like hydrolase/transferase [Candidatus Aminicenantes bacterium]
PGTEGVPEKQGFDLFFGYNCQREAHFYYPEHLWKNEKKVVIKENKNGNKAVYSQDLILEEALQFIQDHSQDPFFLFLPFTLPHAELAVSVKDLNEYAGRFPETPYPGVHYGPQEKPRAAYAAMVSRLDRDIGKIFDLLRKMDLDNNTLVLFSSDNGPHQEGGHDPYYFKSNGPFRGIKRDLYEGGIRVPLIARWPRCIRAGSVNDHVGAFWDFLPTACEIAGIPSANNSDGISFLPALTGASQTEHQYLYWEFHEQVGKQAVLMDKWKGIRLNVFTDPDCPIELFDLNQDQKEQTDVSRLNPEIVKKIDQIMKQAHSESKIFPFK